MDSNINDVIHGGSTTAGDNRNDKVQLWQHGSSFDSAYILASPDLSLDAPTVFAPPAAPASVHSNIAVDGRY